MRFFEMLRQFGGNLMQTWAGLTTSARVQLVLTGLATAALVVFVVAWGASPQYVTLYSGLSQEDSTLIRGKLTELNVPFNVDGNGSIIQVPKNRAAMLRLDLQAEGIPSSHSGVGFEIFDTADLMTSKYVNDVNYKRAVMGTLQQMLNGLDFVNKSQVFITFAEPALFGDEQEPSKAAVTLDVSRKPSTKQVESLLGIITSFAPVNLARDTVTLTLSDGTPLNMPGSDDLGDAADTMLEANRMFEREYKMKAEQALAAIGVQSVVSVSVERDFSRKSEYSEKFEKGVVVSSEESTTDVTSTDSLPQGPTGAISNLPDEDAVVPGGTQTRESTSDTVENSQPSSTVTTTEEAVGRVKAVTASASVGAKRVEQLGEDGSPTGEYTYEKYGDEDIKHFKTTIATNIGHGMTSEDVQVAALDYPLDSVAFGTATGMAVAQDQGIVGRINSTTAQILENPVVWWTTRILLALVAFYLVRRIAKGFVEEELPEVEEEPELAGLDSGLSPEELRKQEIAEEVGKITQQEPDAVAALIRTWLTEDEA